MNLLDRIKILMGASLIAVSTAFTVSAPEEYRAK